MLALLESVAGPDYASALMWTIFALIGLLIILIAIRIVRGLTFGTFVAGGRNRKQRLAVMDATAVDSHRRLVLVRRDDVEHLILIGGPTDVVVEQNIRLVATRRSPGEDLAEAPLPAPAAPPPAPVAVQRPAPAAPVPPRQPAPAPVAAPQPQPAPQPVAAPPRPASQPRFTMPPVVTPPAQPTYVPPSPSAPSTVAPPAPAQSAPRPAAIATPPAPSREPSLDDALLQELEVTLERDQKRPTASDRTLDEEMSKLLGDLSVKR